MIRLVQCRTAENSCQFYDLSDNDRRISGLLLPQARGSVSCGAGLQLPQALFALGSHNVQCRLAHEDRGKDKQKVHTVKCGPLCLSA